MMLVLGDLVWRTSLAAEPGAALAGGERYHADCYKSGGLAR